ncbi:MAG: aminopeptidase N C-terminal domain-containing protein, partial [Syntrophobacteraceae bacterium]
TAANDRVTAIMALNRGSAPERIEIMEETYSSWHSHLSGYANYLRIVASGTHDDVFDMVEKERRRPSFDVAQPTWCRALFLTMANNNKMIWNSRGINWIADVITDLAPVNYTNAGRMLNTFQHVRMMKPELREMVTAALERIVAGVPERVSPAIHRQAKAYLNF